MNKCITNDFANAVLNTTQKATATIYTMQGDMPVKFATYGIDTAKLVFDDLSTKCKVMLVDDTTGEIIKEN